MPQTSPQPWRPCSRCGEQRPFRCSGKFRLNASGKLLDAWLIYKCTDCDETWNRTIVERRAARDFAPAMLAAFEANDPALVRRFAFDVAGLRKASHRLEEFAEADVSKRPLSPIVQPVHQLEILVSVPFPTGLRGDRLVASELGVSRGRVESFQDSGRLSVVPSERRALRRPLRDGTRIVLDLGIEPDAARIASAATGREI